jgi:hypothetical protein
MAVVRWLATHQSLLLLGTSVKMYGSNVRLLTTLT